jgi:hypothetical protein
MLSDLVSNNTNGKLAAISHHVMISGRTQTAGSCASLFPPFTAEDYTDNFYNMECV